MPEVVEVCLTALWLNEKLSNKKLTKVTILGGRYSRHPLIGLDFINKYQPFTINKIDSKGKLLWFELTDQKNKHYYILNRFGLFYLPFVLIPISLLIIDEFKRKLLPRCKKY